MPGWPAMAPPADSPPAARLALVVATGTYTDPGLRRLRAPARDAADLAQILSDPGIGGFAVTTVIDQATVSRYRCSQTARQATSGTVRRHFESAS